MQCARRFIADISCNSSGFGAITGGGKGCSCTTAKAVLEELMSTKCTYPTLQDGNALLCHSCELRLNNIRKAETKISGMKGIVRDQLATLCNPEKRSIAAACDPPIPQAKRLKLTGEVEQRDTAGASSPQIELGNEDSGEVKQSQSPSIQICV